MPTLGRNQVNSTREASCKISDSILKEESNNVRKGKVVTYLESQLTGTNTEEGINRANTQTDSSENYTLFRGTC